MTYKAPVNDIVFTLKHEAGLTGSCNRGLIRICPMIW